VAPRYRGVGLLTTVTVVVNVVTLPIRSTASYVIV
jgi:hypothetical protein